MMRNSPFRHERTRILREAEVEVNAAQRREIEIVDADRRRLAAEQEAAAPVVGPCRMMTITATIHQTRTRRIL